VSPAVQGTPPGSIALVLMVSYPPGAHGQL